MNEYLAEPTFHAVANNIQGDFGYTASAYETLKVSQLQRAFCGICCCHLEQSTNRAQTDVVHSHILVEADNFLHHLNSVTVVHLRTV